MTTDSPMASHPASPDRTVSRDAVTSDPQRWSWRRVIPSCDSTKGPLLTRFHIVKLRYFGVYLHRLHISDDDRALHDHPWSFVTCLISRGYFEWTPTTLNAQCHATELRLIGPYPGQILRRTWHPRFSVLYRPAEFAHRLELTGPTWTLVLRFKVRRRWGFYLREGWLHWKAYVDRFCQKETAS